MRQEILLQCPRCLGKGRIDTSDISRLGRDSDWLPGQCVYCLGIGQVNTAMYNKIAPEDLFLTDQLTPKEREKYINDPEGYIAKTNFIKSLQGKSDKEKEKLIINYYSEKAFLLTKNDFWSIEKVNKWLCEEGLSDDQIRLIISSMDSRLYFDRVKNEHEFTKRENALSTILYAVAAIIGLFILINFIYLDIVDYKVVIYLAISAIGSVALGPVIEARNAQVKHHDAKLSKNINHKSADNDVLTVSKTSGGSTSDEFNKSYGSQHKQSDQLIGIYSYAHGTYKKVLLVAVALFFVGIIFFNYDGGKLSLVLSGLAFLISFIAFIDEVGKGYSHYIYKLYGNRIECYLNKDKIDYTLYLSKIEKLDVEYKYFTSRGGEQIKNIYYKLRLVGSEKIYKIEVYGLTNIETKKSFRDDFSKIYAS